MVMQRNVSFREIEAIRRSQSAAIAPSRDDLYFLWRNNYFLNLNRRCLWPETVQYVDYEAYIYHMDKSVSR